MQTPRMMLFDNFFEARTEFFNRDCRSGPHRGEVYHRACGARIRVVAAIVSVHDGALEGCVGDEDQLKVGVPYCPLCEPVPAAEGCVHVSRGEDGGQ